MYWSLDSATFDMCCYECSGVIGMKNQLMQFWKDEEGATAIEYALIAGLIAAVIVVAVTTLGTDISTLFNTIAGKVTGANTAAGAAG